MNTASAQLLEALDSLGGELDDAVRRAGGADATRAMTDLELRELTQHVEALGRRVDALRIACAGEIDERSRPERGSERMSAQHGCANSVELLTRLTGVSARTAKGRARLGRATLASVSLSGETLPAPFPAVRAALSAGALGLDAADEITRGLAAVADRGDPVMLAAAESELVAAA
ncbi:MAG: hypothetical protein QM611_02015, partial [Microbacterium sp.]